MTKRIDILQVDAFTTRPLSGNPAGVVLDADGLTDTTMQRIAAEMNLSETAFLSRATRADADYRLRWFTPRHEVRFCGHATVATVHALVECGRARAGKLVFETLGGLLPVSIETGAGGSMVWLEPSLPECGDFGGALAPFLAALGLDPMGAWARPSLTTERDLLLPAVNLAALRALEPDLSALARDAKAAELRGVCVVALGGVDPGSRTHTRFFVPHYGVPEDPVTGSVHAAIPVWLWKAGQLRDEGAGVAFTAEQGDGLGRPGRLRVELHFDGGRPSAVRVGGAAVTVVTGTLLLPDS